jgi:imidazolonepropionase-like amidohydrolase
MTSTSLTARQLTVLRAAWLFDGVGATLLPDPMVLIDGASIIAVQQGGVPPAGALIVDLDDATLLPGLIDTHVHLAFDATSDPVGHLATRNDADALTAMEEAGRAALRGGVTTVRDLGDRNYLSLGLRGSLDLPTIVAAGPPITTPGGHCHYLGGVAADGVTGVRAAVRDHVERGVDVIKIMASGGALTPGTRPELSQFSAAELRAAVEEAHRHGLPITAHAHGTQAIKNAVAAGIDGIEHVSFWSEDGVDEPGVLITMIADQRITVGAGVGFLPTPGQPPPAVAVRLPLIFANIARLYQAGAPIAAATDAGIAPAKPHDVVRRALPQLTHIGMGTAEALRTLTSVAAGVCGLAHRKGRIAAGFDADLLAVDGDPIRNPETIHRIRAVYHNGFAVPGADTQAP